MQSPGFRIKDGAPMRPYQIRAAHKLFVGSRTRNRQTGEYDGPDFDGTNVHIDMGLGKTVIALTAIADWYRFGVLTRPTLVVAPIKVCETVWKQEAAEWTHTRHLRFALIRGDERKRAFELARAWQPVSSTSINERQPVSTGTTERRSDVVLVNPQLLRWLKKHLRDDWSFFDALIIDDVALKDHRSQQFRVLSNYGAKAAVKDEHGKAVRSTDGKLVRIPAHRFKRAGKLTGTPSTAGLHNLWSPMYLMDHGARLHTSYDTFEGRFFHRTKQVAPHVYDIDINKEEGDARPNWEVITGAPERIHELMADITIELNADDYGVLPQTIGDASKGQPADTHLHRVELPAELRAKYDALEKDALLELEKDVILAQNGGAKSMMCWQMANGAIYASDDFGQKQVRELHNEKLDKLVELIDRISGNVIVPYYFQHDFARITARLRKEGMLFASLKGSRTESIIDRWNAGYTPILLLHPQSAGHGLNLQFGGHSLIWYTMLWSLERYLQTNARLARSGQKALVNIHHIVTSRTTDELMLSNLHQNGDTQERFRSALREYQRIRGIDLMRNPLEGLGL